MRFVWGVVQIIALIAMGLFLSVLWRVSLDVISRFPISHEEVWGYVISWCVFLLLTWFITFKGLIWPVLDWILLKMSKYRRKKLNRELREREIRYWKMLGYPPEDDYEGKNGGIFDPF